MELCNICKWGQNPHDCTEPKYIRTGKTTCTEKNNFAPFAPVDKPATPKNSVTVNKLLRDNAELKAQVAVLKSDIEKLEKDVAREKEAVDALTGQLYRILNQNRRAAK